MQMTNFYASLIDELYQLGVRDVVISPGSRSTPLALLFCEHDFNCYLNVDERSAAYFALGISKADKAPSVLVCTSGSAAANYLPAVMEAKHSRIPLIILTADRPHELRHCGAPQTVDQLKLFSDYVRHFEELSPAGDSDFAFRYARSVIDRAYMKAVADGGGAVHLNVPIREPLIPDFEALDFSVCRREFGFSYYKNYDTCTFDDRILRNRNGILLCGCDVDDAHHLVVQKMASQLKMPIIADPLSNMRNFNSSLIIDSYDAFLRSDEVKKTFKPDYIIQLGQIPVSKRLHQFLKMHEDVPYILVDETSEYRNPALSTNVHIKASPKAFCEAIQWENHDESYLLKWQSVQLAMRKQLSTVDSEDSMFEGKLVRCLHKALPNESNLVVSNSMAIRYIDAFFEAKSQAVKLFCNRGVNGIEGTVSTALGVSVTGKPTVLLTGDLSFYHDLNGLLVGKTHGLNLVIILLNNDGGGIFEFLPQSQERHYNEMFVAPHGMDFKGLSTLYNIEHYGVEDFQGFEQALSSAMGKKGIQLIEVKLDAAHSKELYETYTTLQGYSKVPDSLSGVQGLTKVKEVACL